MLQIIKIAVLAIGMLLLSAGCAKIGEPLPPQIEIPEAVADLTVRQISDHIVLTFSKPVRNTNGSAATKIQSLEVYRLLGDIRKIETIPTPPIFIILASKFSQYLDGDKFTIKDKLQISNKYSLPFHYAVLFRNNKNQTAGFSNQVEIRALPIPLPPTLSADKTESSIQLKWAPPSENMDGSKPARILGYNIFRSEEAQKVPSGPLNSDLITGNEYKDSAFQFDKIYFYRVSIVGSLNPYVESLPSEALPVSTKDVYPPAPPVNLTAIPKNGVVYLLWVPSLSIDVAGYRIYKTPAGGQKRLLQTDLITKPSFQDRDVQPGIQYEYSISAVDMHGNESSIVSATVQIP
jgi:hypothetical protein